MRDFVVKLYELGTRPMRSEIVKAQDAAGAAALTGARLRSSRFKTASVHADGALLFHVDGGGALTPPR